MQYSGCDLMSAGLMSLSIAYSPVDTISSAVCLPCCQDSLLNEVGPTVHQGLAGPFQQGCCPVSQSPLSSTIIEG